MRLAISTIFLACLASCIGSFLNVVVYRLPRGLSPVRPGRSFCPRCRGAIRWYDNIPIFSWLVLRGRCRQCGGAISLQYPLVECAAVIVTMLLWPALRAPFAGISVSDGWPMIVAVLTLFYSLLALAAMDLRDYWVDIRLTWLTMAVALTCHAISPAEVWPVATHASAAGAGFALGCVIALVAAHLLVRLGRVDEPAPAEPEQVQETSGSAAASEDDPIHTDTAGQRKSLAFVLTLAIVTAALVAWQSVASLMDWGGVPFDALFVGMGLAGLFGAILAGSWLPSEADQQIAEAVEAERPVAVRQAATELLILVVAVLAGVGLMFLSRRHVQVLPGPIAGLATALLGWVVAGGACWLIRVTFTLLLRKEALGFGDVHIIAAAGAVLGPQLAIAGFFLAAPVALLGTAVLAFRKRCRTVPFGPWLAMGLLLATLWGRPLAEYIDNGIQGAMLLWNR